MLIYIAFVNSIFCAILEIHDSLSLSFHSLYHASAFAISDSLFLTHITQYHALSLSGRFERYQPGSLEGFSIPVCIP